MPFSNWPTILKIAWPGKLPSGGWYLEKPCIKHKGIFLQNTCRWVVETMRQRIGSRPFGYLVTVIVIIVIVIVIVTIINIIIIIMAHHSGNLCTLSWNASGRPSSSAIDFMMPSSIYPALQRKLHLNTNLNAYHFEVSYLHSDSALQSTQYIVITVKNR